MRGIQLAVVFGVIAVAYGYPVNEQGKSNLVTGVFIPSDAFKNLQDRANANSNNQPSTQGNLQGGQPNQNQPQYQYQQPIQPVMTNQQPPQNQPQPIMTSQPPLLNNPQPVMTNQPMNNQPMNNQPMNNMPLPASMQPVMSNQPPIMPNQQPIMYTQQPMTANRDPNASNRPMMVMTNQPNGQANHPIIYVQQPSPNQPIYVQPPNQIGTQYLQPGQVIIATNPSTGNQIQGTLVASPNQNQPGSTIYTLIPLNGQNGVNSNSGGSYLIPVQSGGSNPIILSTGK